MDFFDGSTKPVRVSLFNRLTDTPAPQRMRSPGYGATMQFPHVFVREIQDLRDKQDITLHSLSHYAMFRNAYRSRPIDCFRDIIDMQSCLNIFFS